MSNVTLEYGKAVVEFINEPWFQKAIVSIIILLVGLIIARILSKLADKILSEIEINKILDTISGIKIDLSGIISGFVFYFIAFITIIMSLNELGITTTVLQLLAGAILLLVIISVALGIKDFIPNAIAGISIYRKRWIREGDNIRVHDITGKITKIGLNETQLTTKKGDLITIPNSVLVKSEVTKLKN